MSKPKVISVHTNTEVYKGLTKIAKAFNMATNRVIHNSLECLVDIFAADHESLRKQLELERQKRIKAESELTNMRAKYAKLLIDKRDETIRK